MGVAEKGMEVQEKAALYLFLYLGPNKSFMLSFLGSHSPI